MWSETVSVINLQTLKSILKSAQNAPFLGRLRRVDLIKWPVGLRCPSVPSVHKSFSDGDSDEIWYVQ